MQDPNNKRKRVWVGKNGKSLEAVAGRAFNELLSFLKSHKKAKKAFGENEICKIKSSRTLSLLCISCSYPTISFRLAQKNLLSPFYLTTHVLVVCHFSRACHEIMPIRPTVGDSFLSETVL